jgi:hypothetical protein
LPKEINAILTETLVEHAPSYATLKNRVAMFNRGNFSTCDALCHGRPKKQCPLQRLLIKFMSQILAKSTAEQLGISREQVWSIIHEDLDMRKLSANRVPKCLNVDQKHQWCQSSDQLL